MKGRLGFVCAILALLGVFAFGCGGNEPVSAPADESADGVRVKLVVGDSEAIIALVDNAATRDLVARLRIEDMELEFRDFAGAEKIAYPNPALDTDGVDGCDPVVGDLTIYKPWGNLALFYRDSSDFSSSLAPVGRVESNLDLLSNQSSTFTAILSLV